MKPWKRYQQLSCKSKKYIAVGLSVGIALAGLAVPPPDARTSAMKVEPPIEETEPEVSSASVNVSSDMADLAQQLPAEPEKGDPVEVRGIIGIDGNGNVVKESRVVGRENQDSSASSGSTETATEQLQPKIVGALESLVSEKESGLQDGLQQMIPDLGKYENDLKNPNLQLYSYSEQNHGSAPDIEPQAEYYQYPVELGYSVDSNYSGKLTQPLPNLMELTMMNSVPQGDEGIGVEEEQAEDSELESKWKTVGTEHVTSEEESDDMGTQDDEKLHTEAMGKKADASEADTGSASEMVQNEIGTEEITESRQSETEKAANVFTEEIEEDIDRSAEVVASETDLDKPFKEGEEETGLDQLTEDGKTKTGLDQLTEDGKTKTGLDHTQEAGEDEKTDLTEEASLQDGIGQALEQIKELHLREFLSNVYLKLQAAVPILKEQYIEIQRQDDPVDVEAGETTDSKQAPGSVTEQKEDEREGSLGLEENEEHQEGDSVSQSKTADEDNTLDVRHRKEAAALEEEILEESLEMNNTVSEAELDRTEQDAEDGPKEKKVDQYPETVSRILVKGDTRIGREQYVGDIELIPTGENGFDRIRLDTDIEYGHSVVLQEDVSSEDVIVWVTNGKEEVCTSFSYTKDTVNPEIKMDGDAYETLKTEKGEIYCSNSPDIRFSVQDGEQSAGMDCATLIYGDRFGVVFDGMAAPCYTMPVPFYGCLNYSCQDQAGNISEAKSRYVLIEKEAPSIQITESERYTAPYTMGISVEEGGEIVSGIQEIECTVNGQPYEIKNLTTTASVRLADDLDVPAKQAFSLNFGEVGHYEISIRVSDYCGNAVMLHKEIDVTEEELVAVFLAKEFKIYVDPDQLFGREQVFSEGLALKNISNVDAKVTVKELNVSIKSEELENGLHKDCQLYLIAPDTGERIPLQNGKNEDVYSFIMSAEEAGTLSDLDLVGDISVGSEDYWKQDDISINLRFEFEKCAE